MELFLPKMLPEGQDLMAMCSKLPTLACPGLPEEGEALLALLQPAQAAQSEEAEQICLDEQLP